MPIPSTRRTVIFWSVMLAFYLAGYLVIRGVCVETWEKDGQKYVMFPKWPQSLYYLYRPLAYMDARLTGMKFHLGPHTETK